MIAPFLFVLPVAFPVRSSGLVQENENRFAYPFNDLYLKIDIPDRGG